ncbi:calmodulin-binding-domain-containing protein [Zopfochytrium polystomum]|nr:calmodulin-binding-domain-containing protein [Zopfochytrium polystomum]
MYRSKFAKEARKEYVSGMKPSASMGPAKVQVNKPDEFLRRGDRERKAPAATKYEPDRTVRKAPVPKAQPPAAAPSNKNFIKQNALENINSLAKKPNNAEPAYRFKPDYGKKPSYLVSQQQRRLAAAEAKRKEEEEEEAEDEQGGGGGGGERAPGMVVLPEAERIKVLEGLKANWAKLNNDYQKLSLTVDTVPKIARKVNMEQQLRQIESHIAKFSHKNILVNFNPAYRSTSDRLVTSLTF